MLVGLLPIYLLDVLGMSSKWSCATLYHFKNFPFRKTSRWKFLDVKPTHFAVIAAPKKNNLSTAEELDKDVLYFTNTSTQIWK